MRTSTTLAVLGGLALLFSSRPLLADDTPVDRLAGAPPPTCWRGLGTLFADDSLAPLRVAIARAAASNDKPLVTLLSKRLAELIGADSERALEVLAWSAAADEPALSSYLEAVKQAPAAQEKAVRERLFAMAEHDPDPARRIAALDALETQRRLAEPELERLTAIAREGDMVFGAFSAARTLGRIMANDHRATGTYRPYMQRLLTIARESSSEEVRVLAIEMGMYPDPSYDDTSLAELAQLLRSDPLPAVRRMSALTMSTAANKGKVVELFREAFTAERDFCVRWAIVKFTLRAGGPSALLVLDQYARLEPAFAPDVAEFRDLYASGIVDFERVMDSKPDRHCLVDGH